MGFDTATVELLLSAPRLGVRFDRVLTIGRQRMYLDEPQLRALLGRHPEFGFEPGDAHTLLAEQGGFADPFLRRIGAAQLETLDVSAYEGATILHDMNQPLPEPYHAGFSLVVDGGSLEHVFHYPTGLKNCMEAVAPGGHFFTITPANNLAGHGFYQFSPELFFRVFTAANGFELLRLMVYEQPWSGVWYDVTDPETVRSRVELVTRRPLYLVVCAKRIRAVPIFANPPQQSDYIAVWNQSANPAAQAAPKSWRGMLPAWVGGYYRRLRPFRSRYFRRRKGVPFD